MIGLPTITQAVWAICRTPAALDHSGPFSFLPRLPPLSFGPLEWQSLTSAGLAVTVPWPVIAYALGRLHTFAKAAGLH